MAIITTLKSFLEKCVRVWHVLRKPTNDEFKTTAKIAALGILALGLIGFVVSVVLSFFK